MRPHHARAIDKVREAYESDPEVLALIIGGSVAKGWASESSDIDFMAVVTDEVHQRKLGEERLMTYRPDLADYEGGYADGKFVPLSFMKMVAEKGSEPARSAFLGSQVLFDRTCEVVPLVERILVYPEEGVDERIRRFHSQVMIWLWFTREAAKRDDRYLMCRATTEISLFAMRLVLAVNQRFFPYHKWVTRMVQECPDKPEALLDAIQSMLRDQSVESAQAVVDCVHAWRDWPVDYGEHSHHFLMDSEWNWIDHPAPIGDL